MPLSILSRGRPIITHLHQESAPSNNVFSVAPGVEYDTMVREWRCQWSAEGDSASLVACQIAVESIIEDMEEVPGFQGLERVVCTDGLEFKVLVSFEPGELFDRWKKDKFYPEEDYMDLLSVIDGVSSIETKTCMVRMINMCSISNQ